MKQKDYASWRQNYSLHTLCTISLTWIQDVIWPAQSYYAPLIYGSDGAKVYHQQLLRLALSGLDEVVNVNTLMVNFTSGNNENLDNASDKKDNDLAKMAFQLLKDRYPKERGKVEGLCVAHGKMALQRTLEMMSSVMDTELASHLKGRLPILQEKVSLCFVSLFFQMDGHT